jgi:hypothetical protein
MRLDTIQYSCPSNCIVQRLHYHFIFLQYPSVCMYKSAWFDHSSSPDIALFDMRWIHLNTLSMSQEEQGQSEYPVSSMQALPAGYRFLFLSILFSRGIGSVRSIRLHCRAEMHDSPGKSHLHLLAWSTCWLAAKSEPLNVGFEPPCGLCSGPGDCGRDAGMAEYPLLMKGHW